MKIPTLASACCGLLAAATMIGAATPAMAQDDEDIVITGHYGRLPSNVETASQHVSYADLDLSYAADRRLLRHRIELTARYLCDRLGATDEPAGGSVPDCRQAAVRDALARVGTVEAQFAPRGTAWVAPARWQAPYPSAWDTTYP